MPRSWKMLAVAAATTIAALVLSTTALASFTAPSSGGGWATSLGAGSGSVYPGTTVQIPFVVTNTGHDARSLTSLTASIPTAPGGDAETATGADIPGCQASWFAVTVAPAHATVAAGGSYSGRIELTMRNSGTNQDACRAASVGVSVSAG